MSVTITQGADSTPPNGTEVSTTTSDTGEVTNVLFGYLDGTTFTPIGSASGIPVTGTTQFTGMTAGTMNTPVHVPDATSDTVLIAANPDRKGWTIQNNATGDLYVTLGSTASTTAFHRKLTTGQSMGQKIMDGDLWLGEISGIWSSDTGGFADGGDWEA